MPMYVWRKGNIGFVMQLSCRQGYIWNKNANAINTYGVHNWVAWSATENETIRDVMSSYDVIFSANW